MTLRPDKPHLRKYFDYNASAPFPLELGSDELKSLFEQSTANPASTHQMGRANRRVILKTTESLSTLLDTPVESIYYTSGASEGNSWALYSAWQFARARGIARPRFLVSAVEHESTLMAAKMLQSSADYPADVEVIRVSPEGHLDLAHLDELLKTPSDLVSVLFANNETGVVQPVREVAQRCHALKVPLHVDCVQILGKERLSMKELGATYATFSGHKVGAPKGVGFLVLNRTHVPMGRVLFPLIFGKQQNLLRGGTENVFSISLMGKIIEHVLAGGEVFPKKLSEWHRDFERKLKNQIPGVVIHGEGAPRLGNTSFIGFEAVSLPVIQVGLDLKGFAVSSGSACNAANPEASHVLRAMGCSRELALASIRVSSGCFTREEEFGELLDALKEVVSNARANLGDIGETGKSQQENASL